MTRSFRHFLYLLALLLPLSLSLSSGSNVESAMDNMPLQQKRLSALNNLLRSSAIDSTHFAILVTDLASGEVLADFASDQPLIPASIQKSMTIASLLNFSDAEKRYETKVFLQGKLHHGVLDGNLVVKGFGDPSVNSSAEPKTPDFLSEIIDALKKHEIDSIAGKIIIDDSYFAGASCPPSWGSGNMAQSYGTGSHAFNFERNASGNSSIRNIADYFRRRLSARLASSGIALGNNNFDGGKKSLLCTHHSAPLEEVLRSCMMRSDNLYAECFLRQFSKNRGGDGSTEDGADRELKYWKHCGAPDKGIVIVDGSGLSRSNRMTAQFLTYILRDMSDNVDYVSFFPLAGQEGTLKNFMKGSRLDSYLALKTGSMTGIQCYAGYLLDEDFAPTHTVVIIVNNLRADRSILRKHLSDFLLSIF
ncbi:MAG: D-alanyl-D-alanine carboxypeptidase [Prevotella sp.]|nr:D-alanyl-D-alanine carboxypeptidase [Prevotella sp.]MCM1378128.1 D-alanyl-D-alanine carboxypeptidase [Prevotella sp.]MCM1475972.1 D-alanyl-D-alanine carboxypeptidase [Muribaculaceae bacterium]